MGNRYRRGQAGASDSSCFSAGSGVAFLARELASLREQVGALQARLDASLSGLFDKSQRTGDAP